MIRRVMIVDDEIDARVLLRQYLAPHSHFEVVAECDNGLDAVRLINTVEPDLVFLDIKMPGMNGFQVVQQLIHVPRIIFTTAYDQYALKAFEVNAIDYLLKPYTAERFNITMSRLALLAIPDQVKIQHVAEEATGVKYFSWILVEHGNKFVNISVNDILYIKAEKDYSRIHTATQSFLSNYGIGLLEQRMDPSHFIRVHRSYIVNISHIKEVHKDGATAQVILSNQQSLNVSRGYMDELKKLLY